MAMVSASTEAMTLRRDSWRKTFSGVHSLSLHGSNDLEAGPTQTTPRRSRGRVSASTEAMTLRRKCIKVSGSTKYAVSASTEAMTLRRIVRVGRKEPFH